MNLTLKVWRQQDAKRPGKFVTYQVQGVTPDMSFLEMLDLLNEDLQTKGEAPVAFEHDCREGICGSCGFLINGVAHGGHRGTTVCQLSMRFFKDGDSLDAGAVARARRFPCCATWPSIAPRSTASSRPAASSARPPAARRTRTRSWFPRSRPRRRLTRPPASDAARAWPPAPTPRPCCSPRRRSRISIRCRKGSRSATSERWTWSRRCRDELFGSCTNHGECEAVCPKKIPIEFIGRMNRDLIHATFHRRGEAIAVVGAPRE